VRIASWNVNSIKQRLDSAVTWLAERLVAAEKARPFSVQAGSAIISASIRFPTEIADQMRDDDPTRTL
jgi:hypothetical protein